MLLDPLRPHILDLLKRVGRVPVKAEKHDIGQPHRVDLLDGGDHEQPLLGIIDPLEPRHELVGEEGVAPNETDAAGAVD